MGCEGGDRGVVDPLLGGEVDRGVGVSAISAAMQAAVADRGDVPDQR